MGIIVPWPLCNISLVPVIRCAKYLDRTLSEKTERLTEAKRTKHSRACKQKEASGFGKHSPQKTYQLTYRNIYKNTTNN